MVFLLLIRRNFIYLTSKRKRRFHALYLASSHPTFQSSGCIDAWTALVFLGLRIVCRDSLSLGLATESNTVSVFSILNSDSICFLASVRTSAYACSSIANVPNSASSIYTL